MRCIDTRLWCVVRITYRLVLLMSSDCHFQQLLRLNSNCCGDLYVEAN